MSEVIVQRQDEADIELTAASASFQMKCNSPQYDITCKIKAYKENKTVNVDWSLPLPFTFSKHPNEDAGVAITLFNKDGKVIKSIRTTLRKGTWDTKESWGVGFSAQLANWDCQSNSWVVLLRTPPTS